MLRPSLVRVQVQPSYRGCYWLNRHYEASVRLSFWVNKGVTRIVVVHQSGQDEYLLLRTIRLRGLTIARVSDWHQTMIRLVIFLMLYPLTFQTLATTALLA